MGFLYRFCICFLLCQRDEDLFVVLLAQRAVYDFVYNASYHALGHSVGNATVDEGDFQTSYRISDDVHHQGKVVDFKLSLFNAFGKDGGE